VPDNIRIEMIAALVEDWSAELVVVGLPLTLRGEHGAQAKETEAFAEELRARLKIPVKSFDERFTTALAASGPSSRAPEDARAAAHLLESYLTWTSRT
jgi:putative Holliday junction resolvase